MTETKIDLHGNLGKDPEFRNSLKPCVRFPLAFNTKDENGKKKTVWYDVFSFVDIQEIMTYLRKGMSCHVIGTLIEKQGYRVKIRHIIIKENETDIIGFRRDIPRLRNNYNN